MVLFTGAYSELCQTSKMDPFVKIINGWMPWTIFKKKRYLRCWQDIEFASVTIIVIIVINNFFVVDIIQHFKILQIVFRPKKIIKANYKPSKIKVLKDTFQQSFTLHIYWWELKKEEKSAQRHTYLHVHANTHYA